MKCYRALVLLGPIVYKGPHHPHQIVLFNKQFNQFNISLYLYYLPLPPILFFTSIFITDVLDLLTLYRN
jgi:hypothetical protein